MEKRIDEYLAFAEKHPHLFDNSAAELPIVLEREVLLAEQEKLYRRADERKEPHEYYDIGIVAQDPWCVVLRDLVKFDNGTCGGYIRHMNRKSEVENRGSRDVVILVKVDGKFLFLKHFRHDDRKYHLECPRGFGEEGLTGEENARKEVMEETGLTIDRLVLLNSAAEPVSYFYAECSGEIRCGDRGEGIESFRLYTAEETKELIVEGGINDSFTTRAYTLSFLKELI